MSSRFFTRDLGGRDGGVYGVILQRPWPAHRALKAGDSASPLGRCCPTNPPPRGSILNFLSPSTDERHSGRAKLDGRLGAVSRFDAVDEVVRFLAEDRREEVCNNVQGS